MDEPEWTRDPRFRTNADRVKHRGELVSLLSDRFSKHPTAYWLERLKGTGLPNGPVNNMEKTFSHPQVLHRDMVVKVQHPIAGEIKMTGRYLLLYVSSDFCFFLCLFLPIDPWSFASLNPSFALLAFPWFC